MYFSVLQNFENRGHIAKRRQVTVLDDWLTVHRSTTLVDLQLDAQDFYLFTYNIFINP